MLENFERHRRRSQMAIDQEHLLLCSDSSDIVLETIVLEHECECGKIFQQRLHEGLRLLLIHLLFDVMFAHGSPELCLRSRAKTKPTRRRNISLLVRQCYL